MPYETLPHTADVRIRVTASGLESLFSEAARAMAAIMAPGCRPGSVVIREVTVEAEDPEGLLHDFLSELLYLFDAEGLLLCDCRVTLRERLLTATCRGEDFSREKHAGGMEIKGVSYSGLRIYKEGEDDVLEIIFDV
ncbi:MAG: archease [Methanomicrobiales archaeon]|nr:archease [Methanomicrobiales archaeon]MDD1660377.1 archease [Methanomicrobiales archaeon]